MKMLPSYSTMALALMLATAAMPSHAVVTLLPGGGHAVAQMMHDAHVHGEAFRKAVLLSNKTVPFNAKPVNIRKSTRFLKTLQEKGYNSTLSIFDYAPRGSRVPPLRIHARSGKSIEATINDIIRTQTPGHSGGSTSEAGQRVSDNEVLADAGDARFYPVSSEIRATNLQKKDIWVVEPSPEATGNIIHGTDAELKTLRQLEHEFEKNPSLYRDGGELVGYVSQEVCHSCNAALEAFSDHYQVDVTVHYLQVPKKVPPVAAAPAVVAEPGVAATPAPPAPEPFRPAVGDVMSADTDLASRAGSVVLRQYRKDLMGTMLESKRLEADVGNPAAAIGEAAWPDGTIVERAAAAETGHLGLPPVCQGE